MNKIIPYLLFTLTLFNPVYSDTFAVLTAGSSGFWNYRHQSDICHAYHVLRNNGVPAENIIVFAYNDIAYNSQNPFRGQIFNKPSFSGQTSPDVYAGCVIDYQGEDVNKDVYEAVLTGNKNYVRYKGTGRVLESGKKDHVFLNYVDRGDKGRISFPTGGDLYADELHSILSTMHSKDLYKQLVFYLDTSKSGSMFSGLGSHLSVYALSSTTSSQDSLGEWCPPMDIVEGYSIGTCLGDKFGVGWMTNTESTNTNNESLEKQYKYLRKTVKTQDVLQWGDQTFSNNPISHFLGSQNQDNFGFLAKFGKILNQKDKVLTSKTMKNTDVQTQYLVNLYQKSPNQENYQQLQENLNITKKFTQVFDSFRSSYPIPGQKKEIDTTDFDCYRILSKRLEDSCGKVNDFSRQYFSHLYDFCGTLSDTSYDPENVQFNC